MRVCGIDIKANEIIVCILALDRGLFEVPEMRQRRINIANTDDPKQLRAFQQTVIKLMEDYKIDKIAIKGRIQKGKFAGSASGFKIEAVLQLIQSIRVNLITSAVIKETQKYHALPVDFRETGLKAYQEDAFMAAYTQLVGPRYPPKKPDAETEAGAADDQYADDAPTPQFSRPQKPVARKPEPRKIANEIKPAPKQEKPATDTAATGSAPKDSPAKENPWANAKSKSASDSSAAPAAKRENPWKK